MKRGKKQILNAFLRLIPLAAKLVLTLYMGRYFSLSEMGAYGLVLSSTVILTIILGEQLDYVVNRDIVGAAPVVVMQKMRDEALLYFANHIALFLLTLLGWAWRLFDVPPALLFGIFALSVLENVAAAIYGHLNALNRQVFANALFFVRAGLWVLPVVALGFFDPAYRTAVAIIVCWGCGVALSLLGALWGLRWLPWREGLRRPVDWVWLKQSLRKTGPVWIGSVGFACGAYIDRYIAAGYLDLKAVGLITFYTSFTGALFAIMHSGVLAFSGPRLVQFHKDGDVDGFWLEARQAGVQVVGGTALLALLTFLVVPLFGFLADRPIYYEKAGLLGLLLIATWIRGSADVFYNILFARHQDRAVWLGNLLFLIPALGCNMILVPLMGLWGIGVSSILAALFLFIFRLVAIIRAGRVCEEATPRSFWERPKINF
jgi:O-antigen/teichoic acid export membrane protein